MVAVVAEMEAEVSGAAVAEVAVFSEWTSSSEVDCVDDSPSRFFGDAGGGVSGGRRREKRP